MNWKKIEITSLSEEQISAELEKEINEKQGGKDNKD